MFLDSSADILSMCRLNINGWQVKKCSNQSWVWSIFNTDRVLYFFSLHDFFFFQNAWKKQQIMFSRSVSSRRKRQGTSCFLFVYSIFVFWKEFKLWHTKVSSSFLESSLCSSWTLIWAAEPLLALSVSFLKPVLFRNCTFGWWFWVIIYSYPSPPTEWISHPSSLGEFVKSMGILPLLLLCWVSSSFCSFFFLKYHD